jgi:hypothetical protein
VPKEAKIKLDSKGVKCIFIGYFEETKENRLYNLINQYVIINCDVILYESINFNGEKMVSRLDVESKQMIINQELKMEDEKIPQ